MKKKQKKKIKAKT